MSSVYSSQPKRKRRSGGRQPATVSAAAGACPAPATARNREHSGALQRGLFGFRPRPGAALHRQASRQEMPVLLCQPSRLKGVEVGELEPRRLARPHYHRGVPSQPGVARHRFGFQRAEPISAGREAGKRAVAVEVAIRLGGKVRSEEHTSELQSRLHLVCRLLLEKKKKKK